MANLESLLRSGSEWLQNPKDKTTGGNNNNTGRSIFGGAERATPSSNNNQNNDDSLCGSLDFRERMVGFTTCMVGGFILSFGSFVKFVKLMAGNPIPFVLTWTFGNLISLAGSCFLVGPQQQFKAMFHKTRMVATTVYLTSMGLTVLVVVLAQIKSAHEGRGTPVLLSVVILTLMVFQFFAVTWYGLSYVPFARELIIKYVLGEDGDRDQYQQI